jgi:hypothetical protein
LPLSSTSRSHCLCSRPSTAPPVPALPIVVELDAYCLSTLIENSTKHAQGRMGSVAKVQLYCVCATFAPWSWVGTPRKTWIRVQHIAMCLQDLEALFLSARWVRTSSLNTWWQSMHEVRDIFQVAGQAPPFVFDS